MWLFVLTLVILVSLLVHIPNVSAHPGNTSSDGGHYCWTNCEYWGYEYGTRHFHGEDSSSDIYYTNPSAETQGMTNGRIHAETTNRSYIEESANKEGSTDGYNDGYSGLGYGVQNNDSNNLCNTVIEYNKQDPPQSYKNAFQASYASACLPVYKASYSDSYSNSYSSGEKELTAEQEVKTIEGVSNFIIYLFYFGIVSAVVYFIFIRSH